MSDLFNQLFSRLDPVDRLHDETDRDDRKIKIAQGFPGMKNCSGYNE